MDREQLEAWLTQGLSLHQMGALANRDASTMSYWLKKYGLTANGHSKHGPRGGIELDELKTLLEAGLSIGEAARRLGRSASNVRYWIDRYGLPAPKDIRHAEVEQLVERGVRTMVKVCRRHGRTEFAIVGSELRPRCKRCRAEAVVRRRRRVKAILVEEAGGRCLICGFNESLNALEFHHLDPAEKLFGVAQRGITRSLEKVRAEAAKCALLCSNCHARVEAGEIAVPVQSERAIVPPA